MLQGHATDKNNLLDVARFQASVVKSFLAGINVALNRRADKGLERNGEA
jgi:hypothetical protein